MNFYDIPVYIRISFLIHLFFFVAIVEYLIFRKKATRWKEYSFLLFSGIVGALVGMINDSITLNISPDYFVIGKGIIRDHDFYKNVLLLGSTAGFASGAFSSSYMILIRNMIKPIVCSVLFGIIGGVFVNTLGLFVSFGDAADFRFLVVAGIHWGLYIGLVIGVLWGVLSIRRNRKKGQQAIAR